MEEHPIEMFVEKLSPEELAEYRARQEQFDKNLAWLQSNASEVYSHRGKFLCIAGQELFVGDSVEDVVTRAKAAHPDDHGRFTRYIPLKRAVRIYAHRRIMAVV
jgi:hypothetical protein